MDKKVTIKIKSPSASHPDLEFVCDVTNTVVELKDRISREFPTQPSVSGQKLVYSGKILKDSDRLEDVLRFDEDVTKYSLHLVCAIPQKKTSTETEPTAATDNPFPDGLRQRHGGASAATNTGTDMDQMMREFSDQYSDAMASMTANPSEAEMAAMQELYSQYMALYMQYMQSQQQSPVFIPNQQQVPVQAANLPPEGGPGAAAAGAPGPEAPGGLVMNAGAGAGAQIQDEGGVGQRDILDWVYVITRVMLLTSVIYFHSSFLRLAFVAGLGFLVYLYQNQNRAGQLLRRQQQQQQPAEQPQQQPPQRDEAEGTEAGENQDHAEEAAEAVEVMEEPAPSKLAVIVTFLTTLVSSIIPEQPQVI